jgi:MFS family permease
MSNPPNCIDVRAVLAFTLGASFFAYAFVHRVAPSVMTDELMQTFAVGGAALGGLSALYFYAYVAMQVPVGLLMDRYPTRILMTVALLVCGCFSLWLAMTDSFLVASLCRSMIGASLAFSFVGTLTIAHRWFPASQFALLAGIGQSSGMLGAVIGQAPQRMLVEAIGWRGSTLVLALSGFALALLIYWIVPSERQARATVSHEHDNGGGALAVLGAARNWHCALAGFGLAAPMLGFAALWAVPWLVTTRDFAHTDAAGIASLVFAGWMIGSPLAGWVSDKIGRRKPVLCVGAVVSLLAMAAILYAPIESSITLALLFLIQGLGGGVMAVLYSVIRDLNAPARAGTALGMLNMVVVGSGALMQPLIGRWLDRGWDGQSIDGVRIYAALQYEQAFNLLLILNLLSLVVLMGLREMGQRYRSLAQDR